MCGLDTRTKAQKVGGLADDVARAGLARRGLNARTRGTDIAAAAAIVHICCVVDGTFLAVVCSTRREASGARARITIHARTMAAACRSCCATWRRTCKIVSTWMINEMNAKRENIRDPLTSIWVVAPWRAGPLPGWSPATSFRFALLLVHARKPVKQDSFTTPWLHDPTMQADPQSVLLAFGSHVCADALEASNASPTSSMSKTCQNKSSSEKNSEQNPLTKIEIPPRNTLTHTQREREGD